MLRIILTISPQPRAHLKHVFTSTATSYCIYLYSTAFRGVVLLSLMCCLYCVSSSLMRCLLGQHVMCIAGSPCPWHASVRHYTRSGQRSACGRRYLCRVLLVRPHHHRSHSRPRRSRPLHPFHATERSTNRINLIQLGVLMNIDACDNE